MKSIKRIMAVILTAVMIAAVLYLVFTARNMETEETYETAQSLIR